jgi:hypothetical protein
VRPQLSWGLFAPGDPDFYRTSTGGSFFLGLPAVTPPVRRSKGGRTTHPPGFNAPVIDRRVLLLPVRRAWPAKDGESNQTHRTVTVCERSELVASRRTTDNCVTLQFKQALRADWTK